MASVCSAPPVCRCGMDGHFRNVQSIYVAIILGIVHICETKSFSVQCMYHIAPNLHGLKISGFMQF